MDESESDVIGVIGKESVSAGIAWNSSEMSSVGIDTRYRRS